MLVGMVRVGVVLMGVHRLLVYVDVAVRRGSRRDHPLGRRLAGRCTMKKEYNAIG